MPFKAVSDPTRREILELLALRPHSVREIAERFPVSRPAISKHLRLLREAGLAVERKQGRQRFYSLRTEPLREVEGWSRSIVARASQSQVSDGGAPGGDSGRAPRAGPPAARRRTRPEQPKAKGRRSRPADAAPASAAAGADADDWHVW